MADTSIALNRFGLGARAGDPPPPVPRRWLLDQFDRFEPRPAAFSEVASTEAIGAELADYLADVRTNQQALRRARRGTEARPDSMPEMPGDEASGEPMRDTAQQARRFARRQARDHYAAAVGARASAALTTPAPFVERLVHFWSNHFAVSADKLTVVGLAGALEFDAIRPHVLGRFADMLHAVERHPAMLLYLDQAQSVGPDSVAGAIVRQRRQGRQIGLNENLAREILELHTLGVRTGYSQADVTEFARAMTGWTVAGLGNGAGARLAGITGAPGTFVFAPRLHEPGTRTILGTAYPQTGEAQAAAVLDAVSVHPATAQHIATKLARHFAGDSPPEALVARLKAEFLRTGGDLPSVYRVLVEAPECWGAAPVKFRTPWEWSIAALRALGTQEMRAMMITGLMTQLGQPVWRPGSPAGYDDIAASWAGPDALVRRVEAAERMAQRTRDGIDARARAAELFPDALSAATAQSIARAESPGQGVALMLVAPEFLRR